MCGLKDADLPDEAIARARRAYFGAVSYVDDNVGKLLKVLEECGMDEDTIVVFSSDHGDMLGERGLWYVAKYFVKNSTAYLCSIPFLGVDDSNANYCLGTRCPGSKPLLVFPS